MAASHSRPSLELSYAGPPFHFVASAIDAYLSDPKTGIYTKSWTSFIR